MRTIVAIVAVMLLGSSVAGAHHTADTDHPYLRVYGNSAVAGGGFASASCDADPADATITAFGESNNETDNATPANYVGSASELATLSEGQISGFATGNRSNARTVLHELAFANNVLSTLSKPRNPDVGGGYGEQLCAADFPTASSGSCPGVTGFPTNLSGTVNTGCFAQLYTPGDVTITGDITTASNNWNVDDVPLLQVYAGGDIYIDDAVETITGMFHAAGTIHTCTNGTNTYDFRASNPSLDATKAAYINSSQCGTNNLRVYGGLVGSDAQFYRFNGDVSDDAGTLEPFTDGSIAESIIFTPEVYLAYLASGATSQTATGGTIDAIRVLPPVF